MTAWAGSTRWQRLPGNWRTLRKRVLQRDRTCRLQYDGCTVIATEVDHVGDDTDHREQMLRGVCNPCHVKRTQEQSRAAIRRRARSPETHPGVIP